MADVSWPRLYLFGPPRLERNGEAVRFDTRKALALVAYLVLEGPQDRDHLADLLWPNLDAGHARATLRRTLSAIRTAVGDPEILDAERDRVAVRLARLWVDVIDFRRAFQSVDAATTKAVGDLEAAANLGRGDLLAGLSLRDAPDFEHWHYRTREALRKEVGAALECLVELRHKEGRVDLATSHARRWVELDPLHEAAHRWLMRLYAGSGDRAAAMQQYRDCVRILSEELAVTPVDETTRLYESLSAGTPPPGAHPHPIVPAALLPDQLPLVGRTAEEEALRRIATEKGRFVVIEGEAGIGKTRLATILTGLVEDRGGRALEVRCHEEESSHPFGVAARLLHHALEGASTGMVSSIESVNAREALRLIPELRELRDDLDDSPSLDSPGAQTAFFYGVWETLVALLGTGASIMIDDIQWSDAGSIELITYGIRRLQRLPVIIAVTWRRDEVDPSHVLRRVLADAQRSGTAEILSPTRLGLDDVATLVAASGRDEPEIAERLFQETEGVPFFIAEYLKVATSSGGEWPIAVGIKELVRTQVARVSDIADQVITAASVVGRELTLELLEAVSGRSFEETADAVEELERRGLLVQRGGAAYDFSHEKVRQVVFEETSLGRRRVLHRRAAGYLEHHGDATLAAHHALQAGRDADAARLFALAGTRARELFANEEALAHFQAALGLGYPDIAGLHEAIGDINTLLGRYENALASYQAALGYATEADVTARLERRMGAIFLRRGDPARGEPHLRRAVDLAESDAEKSRALAELALSLAATGSGDPGDIAHRAMRAAEAAEDQAALARSHNVAGLLAAERGDRDEATAHLRVSVEVAARLPDPSAHIAALNNLALSERHAGDPATALELLYEAVKLCEKQGDLHRAAALHNNLADVLHDLERWEVSQEHSRRAAELFAQVGEDPIRDPGIWKLVSW